MPVVTRSKSKLMQSESMICPINKKILIDLLFEINNCMEKFEKFKLITEFYCLINANFDIMRVNNFNLNECEWKTFISEVYNKTNELLVDLYSQSNLKLTKERLDIKKKLINELISARNLIRPYV